MTNGTTNYKQANQIATPVTSAMLAVAIIKNDAAGATGNVTVFQGRNRQACKNAVVTNIFSMTNCNPWVGVSFDTTNRNCKVVNKGAYGGDNPIFVLHNTGHVLRLVQDTERKTVEEAIDYYAEEGVEARKGAYTNLMVTVEGLNRSVV